MKLIRFTLTIIATVLLSCPIFAQNHFPAVVKYVTPVYPAAALAVRANGLVIVRVTVDESGGVTSSEAQSGHPLLRKASELAAHEWLFTPNFGTHYVTLRFAFQIAKKDNVMLLGHYTLELSKVAPEIINTRDH